MLIKKTFWVTPPGAVFFIIQMLFTQSKLKKVKILAKLQISQITCFRECPLLSLLKINAEKKLKNSTKVRRKGNSGTKDMSKRKKTSFISS